MRPEYNYIHKNLVPCSMKDCESTSPNNSHVFLHCACITIIFHSTIDLDTTPYCFPESEPISQIDTYEYCSNTLNI